MTTLRPELDMHLTTLAQRYGDRPAVVVTDSDEALSFAELDRRSRHIAGLFRSLGLRAGDHVAFLLRNQIEVFPLVCAAQRAGLLYTPVNWHLAAEEMAYIVDNCEAAVLVLDAQFEDFVAEFADRTPTVKHRFVVGTATRFESLDTALAAVADDVPSDEVEGYPMFYSSGTTGRPKGILPNSSGAPFGTGLPIEHRMRDVFGFGPDSVFLSTGPLYHAMPLAWSLGTIRNGGTSIVMTRFDAEGALRAIEQYRVTHAQFVPTMFVRMLKLPEQVRADADVSSVRSVIHSAAPCPIDVKEAMIEWFGPRLVEFYGGSEANGFFMIDSAEWLAHRGSVGRALIGEPHVLGPDGEELPPGEVGDIWMSGTRPFSYHNDPDKTASVFNSRGWSTLGDLGHLDEDGYLYLSARRTDLILSGGVNIYPQEIEDALVLHPEVQDVAVIGVPDPEMGQRVHAVVTPADWSRSGPELADEMIAFARGRIAHYKAPTSISFEEVPRLPSGKILKRELMKRYAAGVTAVAYGPAADG